MELEKECLFFSFCLIFTNLWHCFSREKLLYLIQLKPLIHLFNFAGVQVSPNNQKKKKIPTVLDVEKKNGRTKKYLLSATIFSLFTLLFLFFQQKKKKKIAKIGDKTGNKNE